MLTFKRNSPVIIDAIPITPERVILSFKMKYAKTIVKMNSALIKADAIDAFVKVNPVKYNMGPHTPPKIPTRMINPNVCLLVTKNCFGFMYINNNVNPITRYTIELKRTG